MMGRANTGAALAAAPAAGSRRVVGTIAEAAAAARAAADRQAPVPSNDTSGDPARDERRDDACREAEMATPIDSESDDTVAPRGNRAPAVEVGDDAERTAAHLIAGRAYAYGRTIVETKGEALRTGDKLAIES